MFQKKRAKGPELNLYLIEENLVEIEKQGRPDHMYQYNGKEKLEEDTQYLITSII